MNKYYWTEKTIPDTKLGRKLFKNQIVRIDDTGITIREKLLLPHTTATRAQIAENLLQMGLITSPEEYIKIMNSEDIK